METILCWSGGKDSTATAILAKHNKIKIDQIITTMPDPFKCEIEFIKNFEDFMSQKVIIIPSPTFENYFFTKKIKGKYRGSIYGWPFSIYKTCARLLKWNPMKKYMKNKEYKFLLGIAQNENRNILSPNESLLLKYGLSENDSKNLCIQSNLLNPLYSHFKRLGCVRCPKQGIASIKKIRELEPEKFQWMLDHDHLSPVTFKPNITFCDYVKKYL